MNRNRCRERGEVMNCPVCGGKLTERFTSVTDHERDKEYEHLAGYNCKKCDMSFNHEGEEI
jgi:YgiT-type zinc finger domain-containing protein